MTQWLLYLYIFISVRFLKNFTVFINECWRVIWLYSAVFVVFLLSSGDTVFLMLYKLVLTIIYVDEFLIIQLKTFKQLIRTNRVLSIRK